MPQEEVSSCPEEYLKQIRKALYEEHGESTDEAWKYRWFFYCDDVMSIWKSKTLSRSQSKKSLQEASINDEIQREQDYDDLSVKEGERVESKGYRIYRDQDIVKQAKIRDDYTCQSCRFHFKKQIVHVHHLDPISERKEPRETTLEDLLTLCPNCHYLAHYFLRQSKSSSSYKEKGNLLNKLQELKWA